MINNQLKKDLINHKIYSAWQFMEYTNKNIETTRYCSKVLTSLIEKMKVKTERWEKEIALDFVDDINENGKKVKRLSATAENAPTYIVRVVGEKINPWFLFNKLLRDFFQYSMNSFDSMGQIINAGLLLIGVKKSIRLIYRQ